MDIFRAVHLQNINVVRGLLEENPSLANAVDSDGNTILIDALRRYQYGDKFNIPIITLLLEYGANPNVFTTSTYEQDSPLTKATEYPEADPAVVKLLLKFGADPNLEDVRGYTALDRLISRILSDYGRDHKRFRCFEILVNDPHIDLDRRNRYYGETYLTTFAKSLLNTSYIELLLKAGADPFIANKDGQLVVDILKRPLIPEAEPQRMRLLKIILRAMATWTIAYSKASSDLTAKFMIARRLRQESLPQRDIADGIVRKAEYDHVCRSLQSNLLKPAVIALARSLHIPTSNKTKYELCDEISKRLII